MRLLRALGNDDGGAIIVLAGISLAALMGFVALVTDVGLMEVTRRQLQSGVDGAALAGAWQLPKDSAGAVDMAYDYAARNGLAPSEVTDAHVFRIFQTDEDDAIEVKADRTVNLFFARALGMNTATVGASATAIVAPLKPGDLWPWGVPQSQIGSGYGVMKLGAPDSMTGNFWALDYPPGGGGAAAYRDDIEHGWDDSGDAMPPYDSTEPYSWWVATKTGVIGSTKQATDYLTSMSDTSDPPSCVLADPYHYNPASPPAGFNPRLECWRIGLVPVATDASWEAAKGTSNPVEMIGFAAFYFVDFT
ncbi:MAG: hypothetical protein HY677_04980, partial [Chloroflexi bacterium]|nr:hypothetical protein [Chloroflexota bacterium]